MLEIGGINLKEIPYAKSVLGYELNVMKIRLRKDCQRSNFQNQLHERIIENKGKRSAFTNKQKKPHNIASD